MSYTRNQLLQIQSSARVYQARADDAFESWGFRAKEPTIGEDPDRYRRRLMIQAKNQLPDNHELRKVTVNHLPDNALGPYEDLLFKACKAAALRSDSVPPGEMRRVEKINQENGHKEVHWIGQHSFIHDMKPPVRRVIGFRTSDGFVDITGAHRR